MGVGGVIGYGGWRGRGEGCGREGGGWVGKTHASLLSFSAGLKYLLNNRNT